MDDFLGWYDGDTLMHRTYMTDGWISRLQPAGSDEEIDEDYGYDCD